VSEFHVHNGEILKNGKLMTMDEIASQLILNELGYKQTEWISEEEVRFILSFAPKESPEELPKNLDPTFYHTLRYKGDLKIAERLQKIRNLLPKPPTGGDDTEEHF